MRDMTVPAEQRRHTIDEYLRIERDSRDKHELHHGEILAMSGGSPTHSLISMNVGSALNARLKSRRFRVYDANLRISIPNVSRYVYADATVICGPTQFDPSDSKQETVLNPRVVVEVLSPSTEAYDRGAKFDSYRTIASLEEYVLVAQNTPRIDVFFRGADGSWLFYPFAGLNAVAQLRSIQVDLPLGEAYAGVEFPPAEAEPGTRQPT